MRKTLILIIFLLLSVFLIFSSEDEGEEDEIQTIRAQRNDILKYGIDSEVITLLNSLNTEKIDEFNDEILNQLNSAVNNEVITAAYQLFITTDYKKAEDNAIGILEDNDLYNNTVLSRIMTYLGNDMSDRAAGAIIPLLNHEQAAIARSAVYAIGKSGNEDYAEELISLLEDDDFHDEVKTTVLVSLGDIEAEDAIEILTDIAEDIDEEKAWRWYACQSLGKIGARESFPVLKSLLGDDDPNLRAFAVEGVGYYDTDDARDILISSLRDSFWKVRISAAKQLGERVAVEAVPILIYKAGNDPEINVRKEAITALGMIGEKEGFNYLRELAESKRTNPAVWAHSVEVLSENDLEASMDVFETMVEGEWDADQSYYLDLIGKTLSSKEGTFLEKIAGRFLLHSSIVIKIYGIRMTELNGFANLKERITELSGEEHPRPVRQAAVSALENI